MKGNKVAIAAIFKNEYPYILEWLAYHISLGVNKFYIADNISTDGSSELLDELHDLKVITRVVWPTNDGVKPQLPAYNHIAKIAKEEDVEWLLFIDADEFIVLDSGIDDFDSYINLIESKNKNVGAVAINWAVYGSSNIVLRNNNNVIESFDFRMEQNSNINRHYKTLLRLDSYISTGGTPHGFEIKSDFDYTNSNGELLDSPLRGLSDKVVWENIRINHYMIKSKGEFALKKMLKGRASSNSSLDFNYFNDHDVNSVHDPIFFRSIRETNNIISLLNNKLNNKSNSDNSYADSLYYLPSQNFIGCVDQVSRVGNELKVTGWLLDKNGRFPETIRVIANDCYELNCKNLRALPRMDVKKAIKSCNTIECGFSLLVVLKEDQNINSLNLYFGNDFLTMQGKLIVEYR